MLPANRVLNAGNAIAKGSNAARIKDCPAHEALTMTAPRKSRAPEIAGGPLRSSGRVEVFPRDLIRTRQGVASRSTSAEAGVRSDGDDHDGYQENAR